MVKVKAVEAEISRHPRSMIHVNAGSYISHNAARVRSGECPHLSNSQFVTQSLCKVDNTAAYCSSPPDE